MTGNMEKREKERESRLIITTWNKPAVSSGAGKRVDHMKDGEERADLKNTRRTPIAANALRR